MKIVVAFILFFLLVVLFSELLPVRQEIHGMYSKFNDIAMSADVDINLDLFHGESPRVEYACNAGARSAVMYLDAMQDKSRMTRDAIDLMSEAVSGCYVNPVTRQTVRFHTLDRMRRFAINSGLI